MPILFTLFFGFILNPVYSADSAKDNRLAVGIINQDVDGLIAPDFVDLLNQSESIRPTSIEDTSSDQVNQQLTDGDLAAVVIIPAGYSDHLLSGQEINLQVIVDQNTVAGQTAATTLETAANRLLRALETARLSAATFEQQAGFENDAQRETYIKEGFSQAMTAWKTPPLSVQVQQSAAETSAQDAQITSSGFVQSSSGMIVQFAVFGLITSAMILVLERKHKVLQRLLTTSIRPAEIIAGHMLAMFLIVFAQEIILVLLGQFAFGVNYLRQPWAILLMMVCLAIWAASLGLLIGAISKKEDQVILLSLIAMFVFAALGGAWFPLEITGPTFSAIGHIMPTAWAMDGFQNIILRGLGASSVLVPAGILTAYSIVFFALAVWRFRYE